MTTAKLFLNALDTRQKDIPNLISPHLGDRVPVNSQLGASISPCVGPPNWACPSADAKSQSAENQIVALPLGGRIKMDPWSDKLEMLKAKPVGTVAEREKMPFEVTPFMLYLTRENNPNSSLIRGTSDSKEAADKAAQ